MEKETYFQQLEFYQKPSIGLKSYLTYILQEEKFKRKQTIKLADISFNTTVFIVSGTVRLFFFDEEKEITVHFYPKNTFLPHMNLLSGYFKQELMFEFLEDSVLLGFPEKHFANLFKLFPEYWKLEARISQSIVCTLMEHSISLAHLDSRRRLENLMASWPELFIVCELKHIANFLGIHPKVLSQLRSKALKR